MPDRSTQQASEKYYSFWPGNVAAEHVQVGDFILTRTPFDWRRLGTIDGPLISFGQALRFGNKWSWANHAALVCSEAGTLIEALSSGVQVSHIDKYEPLDYYLIKPEYNQGPDDPEKELRRRQATRFAASMLGTEYGWFTVLSLAFTFVTGSKFWFGRSGTVICSGLVAAALGNYEWRADPSHVAPAQLARRYGVTFEEVQ